MSRPTLYLVDAFTEVPFEGNPATVCLFEDSSEDRGAATGGSAGCAPEDLASPEGDSWMRRVAREVNMVTAFVRSGRIFWYTSSAELLLCGHGTIAATKAMAEAGRLSPGEFFKAKTREGHEITAAYERDGTIALDFPASRIEDLAAAEEHSRLWEALFQVGCAEGGGAPRFVTAFEKTDYDLLVVVDSVGTVDAMKVDHAALAQFCWERGFRGVIVSAREVERQAKGATARASFAGEDIDWNDPASPFDIVSRFFAPAVDLNEDPVCGSAHCALGPSWKRRLGGQEDFVGVMRGVRPGRLRVNVRGGRVKLGGKATTIGRMQLLC